MPSPIYTSVRLARNAIKAALQARTTRPVRWWRAFSSDTRPYVVIQSQDLGGRAEKRVGDIGWSGLIVVKAVGDLPDTAEQLMAAVAPGMEALSSPGYTIRAEYDRPIALPPDGDTHSDAHQWRVSLHRS